MYWQQERSYHCRWAATSMVGAFPHDSKVVEVTLWELLRLFILLLKVLSGLWGLLHILSVFFWASEQELQRVIRVSVLLVGLAGTGLAFGDDSVFAPWLLRGDLLYCVILPQLICVLHFSCVNSYGAFSGYVVGLLLHELSGEKLLGIPPLLLYPGWREEGRVITQYFP